MSKKHLRYSYRDSASKPHKAVGEVLRTHPKLKGFKSLQEYPLKGTPFHIDWVIPDLKIAIEVHGEQHYGPVCFGGITKEVALIRFEEQKKRDSKKRELCGKLGWKLVELSTKEPLDANYIANRIFSTLAIP